MVVAIPGETPGARMHRRDDLRIPGAQQNGAAEGAGVGLLQKLMRHELIDTTMEYYADVDAERIADDLWGGNFSGNSAANSAAERTEITAQCSPYQCITNPPSTLITSPVEKGK